MADHVRIRHILKLGTTLDFSEGQLDVVGGAAATTESMRVYRSGALSTTTGAIQFDTVDEDTAAAWNNTTKQWTCPADGLYLFTGYLAVNDFRNLTLTLYRNGLAHRGMLSGAQAFGLSATCVARMAAGNTAYLHAVVSTASTFAVGPTGVSFEVLGPL